MFCPTGQICLPSARLSTYIAQPMEGDTSRRRADFRYGAKGEVDLHVMQSSAQSILLLIRRQLPRSFILTSAASNRRRLLQRNAMNQRVCVAMD